MLSGDPSPPTGAHTHQTPLSVFDPSWDLFAPLAALRALHRAPRSRPPLYTIPRKWQRSCHIPSPTHNTCRDKTWHPDPPGPIASCKQAWKNRSCENILDLRKFQVSASDQGGRLALHGKFGAHRFLRSLHQRRLIPSLPVLLN